MIKNYLKVALRNLVRHKAFSFINVFGLAVGMVCCILILLYVQDELSYDTMFDDHENIYRFAMRTQASNGRFNDYPSIGGGVAQQLKIDFPEVVSVTRMFKPIFGGTTWVVKDNERFSEDRFFSADSNFFKVLNFPFAKGNPQSALAIPYSLVITEEIEKKYFGDADGLNQKLGYDLANGSTLEFTVTGVLEDMPGNTHMHFDFMTSFASLPGMFSAPPQALQSFFSSWQFTAFYTYFKVPDNFDIDNFENQLPAYLERHTTPQQRQFVKSLYTQKLTDIHLHSNTLLNEIEPNSNIAYIYIFTAIAILTLLIACINFMNLSTARSGNRAKEVGMRKVMGAYRGSLVKQFMGESTLITGLSLLLAVAISYAILPAFNQVSGKSLTLDILNNNLILFGLILIAVFVGSISGSYPALFLSAFRPIEVLKGKVKAGSKSSIFRKVMVVGQFAISIMFITGALIVYDQLEYLQEKDLGFNKDFMAVIPLNIIAPDQVTLQNTVRTLKSEFAQVPNIERVSSSIGVPGGLRPIVQFKKPEDPIDNYQRFAQVTVDYEYVSTMDIELLEGRNFSREFTTDSSQAIILNGVAAELLGLEPPYVGKKVQTPGAGIPGQAQQTTDRTIIGIIRNINYEPLYRTTSPMVFVLQPNGGGSLLIKLKNDDISGTMAQLEQKWKEIVTNRPFIYTFLDEDLNELYVFEHSLGNVVKYFTVLAIFIACLGLFGLASFTAEQRTKEIGIRKVLGATVAIIVKLLTVEFVKLVLVANLFAWPIAYYFANDWLQKFAFHISPSMWIFFISGLLAAAIAILTVSYQAIKAATVNPVTSLKHQ